MVEKNTVAIRKLKPDLDLGKLPLIYTIVMDIRNQLIYKRTVIATLSM